ncbi:MAG: type I-D CRISPR-associated protein Cas10d/Csc3 [Anaerolineales bacterium]|nr:MAG: type I-D CRISPR-associated protein Cas10d/Csc3 [Anaerolineales bacterium]
MTMTDDEQRVQEDYLLEDEEEGAAEQETISLAPEPLFSALLRDVIVKLWPDDTVMADFVDHVAAPLSDYLGHRGAKGGEFVEERRAKGLQVDERYIYDQTMRAHLVNGLLPVLHVARTLQAWGAPQFRAYDDSVRRLFIAGYVLHDYLKLPEVEKQLEEAGFSHEQAIGPAQLSVTEQIFRQWCATLGLEEFLAPVGGVEEVLHDLIYIAANTQTRWGTLRNLSVLPRLTLPAVQRDLAEQLSRLADYLAYIARTPQEAATNASIQRELTTLSNHIARFTYHHLADNRGVLSNFIHNAALSAMSDEHRVPLLYAPSGVVYLEHKEAPPPPAVAEIAEATIQNIQKAIVRRLHRSLDGIKRDGKGLKYADYYWLFFDLPTFVKLGVQAAFGNIHEGKKPSSGKRYAKMKDKGWLDPEVDLDLPDDVRVDQLAEWCYLAEKQIAEKLPDFDVAGFLLNEMSLQDLREPFEAASRIKRAGGVAYYWYFAAGHYLKRHPGLDPAAWQEQVEGFARQLVQAVREAAQSADVPPPESGADWDDLRAYISRTLTLGAALVAGEDRTVFAAELHRYQNAKRRGRGTTHMCALCSSTYRVDKQADPAVLFAPQVYSNKLQLGGSQLRRDICSICGLEMMLRQNLMNRSAATGKDFENRRVRYLYFYPTYFFTPETLDLFRRAYTNIRRISFTELRRQLVGEEGTVDLSPETLQRLEPLLLTPEEEMEPEEDRYVRLHFPAHEPMTFYFLGVPPPGRDAKDAASWVHPAFLALLLPLCLDVKVVASESSLPLMVEADEITETVFLDGPHAAISYLTGGENRINVDRILPTLQRLIVGYLIHTDANTAPGSNDFYRWQDLPALARALDTSPLYAFHYLKKWQRKQKFDTIPSSKARQYLTYITHLMKGGDEMSHARTLTKLYRKFYRAKRRNTSSILRPLSIAARTVLETDPRLFDREGVIEAVYGEVYRYIERGRREGLFRYPRGSDATSREQAMREFTDYFVNQVFHEALRGDKSALRGKQLNLLKSACEVIYREADAREWAERDSTQSADDTSAAA